MITAKTLTKKRTVLNSVKLEVEWKKGGEEVADDEVRGVK